MKATLEVELQPFQTPNFVRAVSKPAPRQDAVSEPPCYPLSDLDSLTLDKLCNEFRKEVFRKAGKEMPPEPGEGVMTLAEILHVLRNPHGWNDHVVRDARLAAADTLERIQSRVEELKADICRQAGRYGIHGHESVDDDYFLALEYTVKRIGEDLVTTDQFLNRVEQAIVATKPTK